MGRAITLPASFLMENKMSESKDLTGLHFGRLVVQWPVGRQISNVAWLCLCGCGNLKVITSSNLCRTKSCGCINKEKAYASEQKRLFRKANKKKASGKCLACLVILTVENSNPSIASRGSGRCNECRRNSGVRDEEHRKAKISRDALRNEVFDKLGHKCSRCGFDDKRALQVDHINGGGEKDRQRFSQTTFLQYVLANPELFQILCANCNWIKRHENEEVFTKKNSYKHFSVHKETDRRKLKDSSDVME